MDNNEIRELAQIMVDMDLTVLDLNSRGETIRLERGTPAAASPVSVSVGAPAVTAAPTTASEASQALITDAPDGKRALPAPSLYEVKSPTVGTFYCAPAADKEPFVTVGAKVSRGDTLCILEAMKMLNEIQAEKDGVITEVCISNKQVVEFGQVLFRIDTSVQ